VLNIECMPGDRFRGSTEILLRLAPLAAPIYDQIQLFVHFFFVPYRIIWKDWEKFITGGRLGVGIDPVDAPIPPYIDLGEWLDNAPAAFQKSSIMDYLGFPVTPVAGATNDEYDGVAIDVIPALVYQACWYEYYRDRNFISDTAFGNENGFPFASGQIAYSEGMASIFAVRTRDYLKEYFTSALPFTQRGEEVLMPLAGSGSVTYEPFSKIYNADGSQVLDGSVLESNTTGVTPPDGTIRLNPGGADIRVENIDEVNLETSSVTINDFRTAYALQVWYERNAIAGSKYEESNMAHFKVRTQDARLQKPEFLGGGRIMVKISEVVTTAFSEDESSENVPAGNLFGRGVTYGNTNQFNYFCPEHGMIIGIASIMAEPSYHQGVPRMFYKRRSFLDYPWPTFAKLGEQEVDKVELYNAPANFVEDEDGKRPLFGYQSRYVDWKYIPNTSHGDFHDTLMHWTLTRDFSDTPELGIDFLQFDDATQDQIFIVGGPDNDNFWLYINNKVMVNRCLPYIGTPNNLGFA